jgi:hypothetical protein
MPYVGFADLYRDRNLAISDLCRPLIQDIVSLNFLSLSNFSLPSRSFLRRPQDANTLAYGNPEKVYLYSPN